MVVIFIVGGILFLSLVFFLFLILSNFNIIIYRLKIFFLGFLGDFELFFSLWGIVFLSIVVIISIRVLIFTFSYIYGIIVGNFVFLYLSFIFRII
jgi:hypothetical protein